MTEASYEEIRKQRLAEQADSTRTKILEAAARVMAREGFRGSTVRGIAREAGYTASSLYTYFPNKEAIFAALREWLISRGREAFDAPLPASLTLVQKFELLTQRLLERTMDTCDIGLPPLVTKTQLPDETFEEHLDASRGFLDHATAWVEDNSTPDERNGHSSLDLAHAYVALLHGMAMQAALSGDSSRENVGRLFSKAAGYIGAILAMPPKL